MAEKSFADALNEQIANEFAASQQYVGAAVYYDAETLPRLAAFFYRQALEEREHAMIMIQYLLDTDEKVQIPDIKSQETSYARRQRAGEDGARAGETGQRRDLRPLRARPRAQGLPRRAVPAVVRQRAGRGGRADERPAQRGRALEGQPAARRGVHRPREPRRRSRPTRPRPPPPASSASAEPAGAFPHPGDAAELGDVLAQGRGGRGGQEAGRDRLLRRLLRRPT